MFDYFLQPSTLWWKFPTFNNFGFQFQSFSSIYYLECICCNILWLTKIFNYTVPEKLATFYKVWRWILQRLLFHSNLRFLFLKNFLSFELFEWGEVSMHRGNIKFSFSCLDQWYYFNIICTWQDTSFFSSFCNFILTSLTSELDS